MGGIFLKARILSGLFAWVLIGLLLAGCGGGPSTDATITGTVRVSLAGAGVDGATVNFNGKSTATSGGGNFTLAVISGTYDLLISKSGRAQTRIQAVLVSSGQTLDLEPILLKAMDPTMSATAPTMTVSGLDGTLAGSVDFTVSVTASYAVKSIHCRIGNQDMDAEGTFDDASVVEFTLPTINYTDGPNIMVIRAVDINNNMVERDIPITIDNGYTMPAITLPPVLTALRAVTVDYEYGIWSAMPKKAAPKFRSSFSSKTFTIKGKVIDISAVPAGCNLYTIIFWLPQDPNEWSYRVYRATIASGPWTKIFDGLPKYQTLAGEFACYDTSSKLTPDITYYYKVSSYNEAGEGPDSEVYSVQPLSKLSVSLISPAQNATDVSLTPTLSWSCSGATGYDDRAFELTVIGVNDSGYSWEDYITSNTSEVYGGASLVAGKTYEWDIVYAEAYRDSDGPDNVAVSVAINGSNNGAYTFTTAE